MKKIATKTLALLMVLLTVISIIPFSASAASVRYLQTVQDNVILRTGPANSYNTNTRTVAAKGTVVRAVGSTTNSSGNLWYKLDNGYWVYSARVTSHTHSYYGGRCRATGCGYEYPLSPETFNATVVVTNSSGAKAWSRPYSENSTHVTTYGNGTTLVVNARVYNINSSGGRHNLWYRLSNGYWVYSGNVKQRFTVTYNANGGTGGPSSQSFLAGNTLTLSSSKPTRSGKTFKGWATSASSTTVSYQPGGTYSGNSNLTLYAVWGSCNHSYFGGICTKCNYEAPLSPTAHNGTFVVTNNDGAKGWSRPYSNNSRHLATYPKNSVVTVMQKVKNVDGSGRPMNVWYRLTDGNWVYSGHIKQRFTVAYNANGGTGAPATQIFYYGETITLSSVKPTRAGYQFKGWSSSASSSDVICTPGARYSSNRDITLYAVWYRCSHTYLGGICTKCNYEAPLSPTTYNGTFVVTNNGGAKGWSRPYSDNSTHRKTYAKNSVVTVVQKVTNVNSSGNPMNVWYKLSDGNWVYSGHIKQRFTVTYNANGGTGSPSSQTFLSGNSLTLSSSKPTRSGYQFKGWATSASSTTVSYQPGATYATNKNITLYAVWYRCSHTYNGGICTKCRYEAPLSPATYNGTFVVVNNNGAKGWSRPYSDNSTHRKTYAKNAVLTVVKKVTNVNTDGSPMNVWYQLSDGNWVYSGNIKQRYTVTYNANGGTGGPSSQTFLSGSTLTLSSSKPSKTGYQFRGWATSASSSTVKYNPGSTYSTKKDLTLYAVWSACSHTYNGGICTKCRYEAPLSPVAYSGKFVVTNNDGAKGWSRPYSDNSTHRKTYAKNTVLTVVQKVTNVNSSGNPMNVWYKLSDGNWVYSGNIKQRYTVTYNANGGTGGPSSQTFLAGNTLTLSSSKPTRSGYIFKGWSTSATSSTVKYNPGARYSTKKDLTLYAVWSACSHTYNSAGKCTKCNYSYPLSLTTLNGKFKVIKNDGAPVRNTPYDVSGSKVRTASKNSVLTVVAKTTNQKGELWYKLSDGNWVFSGNVKQCYTVTYNANGGTGAPSPQTFLTGATLTLSTTKPTRPGYVFNGWAISSSSTTVKYNPGARYSTKKDLALYAVWARCSHSYNSGGVCTKCTYSYPLTLTTLNAKFVVTNDDGATIRNTPYDVSGSKVRKASKNSVLTVVAKTTNQKGSLWYKLSDGNWVFSGNVKQRFTVKYNAKGGINAPAAQYVVSGNKVTVTNAAPKKSGYDFMGWAKSSSSSSVAYRGGSRFTVKSDVTLYAVWQPADIRRNYTNAFSVPGLADNFVPQGICYIDAMGVYAISGYVENQVSRIYLVNAQTGSVKRVNLKNFTSHAGGIASNGTDVWVSSGGNENRGGYVYHTTVNALRNVANNGTLQFDGKFQTLVKGSALFCNDDTLWVCEFYKKNDYPVNASHAYGNNHAWACGYDIPVDVDYSASTLLLPDKILSIPDKVQGMCITDNGDVVFSTSHGRFSDSELIIYSDLSGWKRTTTTVNGRKIPLYSAKSSNLIAKVEMPTLMEGLDFHNGKMYVLFESGAKTYSNAKEVIKTVWKTDINNVIARYK